MTTEIAWLIETDNGLCVGVCDGLIRLTTANSALRFAREEDARAMLAYIKRSFPRMFEGENFKITEHMWTDLVDEPVKEKDLKLMRELRGIVNYTFTGRLHGGTLQWVTDQIDKLMLREATYSPAHFADNLCFYCGEMTDSLTADPYMWPVHLPHPECNGVAEAFHTKCVYDRLFKKDEK